jgi:hypothetical protein
MIGVRGTCDITFAGQSSIAILPKYGIVRILFITTWNLNFAEYRLAMLFSSGVILLSHTCQRRSNITISPGATFWVNVLESAQHLPMNYYGT